MVPSARSIFALEECNSIRVPDGETDGSNRYESRL